jgi:ceramide glucosyltransferase
MNNSYTIFAAVSILKPLKGLDDQLEKNLRSFFELDYPEYELLFGIADTDDPAIPVVEKLQTEYPQIPSKLIVNDHKIGLNPKVNNLFNILPSAKYEYILISDSNVRTGSTYLKNLMNMFHLPHTGLVTSTIRGIEAHKIGSVCENLHLNSFISPSVFAINALIGLPISIGKSMLFQKEILQKIGGFWTFRDILAEDHLMGMAIKDLGLEIRNCPDPINNINENWKLKDFYNRHLRWAKLRKNTSEFYYLVESLSNPIPIALLYTLFRFDLIGLIVFLFTVSIKISIDFSNVFKISKNTQLIPISKE